ncbi:MAG: hypothetical protein ACPLSA_00720 [Caldanaerobacter sp.]
MNRFFLGGIILLLIFSLIIEEVLGATQKAIEQIKVQRIESMPDLPSPLLIRDFKKIAIDYDKFVFDFERRGVFLPLGWWDKTHYNLDSDTFGLLTFVGSKTQFDIDGKPIDGSQEGINCIAAVLSATLVGIDKSSQRGYNYVKMTQTFFNKENREYLVLNNPFTTSGKSFWYEIFPHILFYGLVYHYKDVEEMRNIMKITADRWHDAVLKLSGAGGIPNFNHTAFMFSVMEPVDNGRWTEPDAAAGVALLEYWAYKEFKDPKYLEATKRAMNFLEIIDYNPIYEVLGYFAPYVAARLNAEEGVNYPVEKFMDWVFNRESDVRPGWGMITGKWGEYTVDGLFGSITDGGGYAFSMNTFDAAFALVPVARYDLRYAKAIGKWMLHLTNNAKLFYKDCLPEENQSSYWWREEPSYVIPYEGLRKIKDGRSPFAGGDGWGKTDFSLYSGSHVGFLGSIVSKTNIEGILQIDLTKTDFFKDRFYPTYLYYNPYDADKEIIIDLGDKPKDVFDLLKEEFVHRDKSGKVNITIPAKEALVVAFTPPKGKVKYQNNKVLINNIVVSYNHFSDGKDYKKSFSSFSPWILTLFLTSIGVATMYIVRKNKRRRR